MLRLLSYLIGNGIVTAKEIPEFLDDQLIGFPKVTSAPCNTECNGCVGICPTEAIKQDGVSVAVDRGACIQCNQCIEVCPSGTLVNDVSVKTYAFAREKLINSVTAQPEKNAEDRGYFTRSLSIRVVSTGCSACDMEVAAANNPLFDMERFGVNIVASPRFADALLITGPVPKNMHEALKSCYESMAAPKIVIACGTCAISGGVHKNGYAMANGVGAILPVDVHIPGCAPHPWQIIKGVLAASRLQGRRSI